MSTALERRMTKLEAAACPEGNRVALILRRIIRADNGEIVRAIVGEQVVDRQTDEPEDDFMARSKVEALSGTRRRPSRVILLSEQDIAL